MKRLNRSGFTMMELLVVLLIIAILAAVAAPFFFQNADRAKASEAVSAAGSIRSGERNYSSTNNGGYLDVTDGGTYFGSGTSNQSAVLGVQIKAVKYFSPESYIVTTVTPGGAAWPSGIPTSGLTAAPKDFLITVNGLNSLGIGSASSEPAPNAGDVKVTGKVIEVAMDNSGQIIWTSNGGTSWSIY